MESFLSFRTQKDKMAANNSASSKKRKIDETSLIWSDEDVELLLELIKEYKSKKKLRGRPGLGERKGEI